MLSRPSSSAAVLVSPRTPHLLATYAESPCVAVNPAPEEILTIAPPPALRIEDATARIPRYKPVRLTSITWCQTAGSVSSSSPKRTMPALLISTETGPKASSAAATVAAQSLSFVTSRREKIAWSPSSSTSVRPSGSRMSAITTFAPSATKPRAWLAPMPRAPPVTITVRLSKRFMILSFHCHHHASAPHVDEKSRVYAVAVPRLVPKEARRPDSPRRLRVVLGSDRDEPIVAAQTPAAVEPLDAAADIAGKERLGVVDPEVGLIEHSQAADAARHERHDRAAVGGGQDEIAAVVQQVRRLQIQRFPAELQVLRDAERASHFTFDGDVSVEVDLDARTKVVVAEAWSLRLLSFCEERRSSGNDRDDDGARAGQRVLCVRRPCSNQSHRCQECCDPTRHD